VCTRCKIIKVKLSEKTNKGKLHGLHNKLCMLGKQKAVSMFVLAVVCFLWCNFLLLFSTCLLFISGEDKWFQSNLEEEEKKKFKGSTPYEAPFHRVT